MKTNKNIVFSILTFGFFLLFLELVFLFLPVSGDFDFNDVNEENPIFHAKKNNTIITSKYWDFYNPQKIKINNYGFRSDKNYFRNKKNVISIIGDSYVEAIQVPYKDTFMNVFDEEINGKYNVYSFGFSGAPLSQYLKWAEYSTEKFNSEYVVFNIISNDFDESLYKYKNSKGFHFFKKCGKDYCNKLVPYKKKKYRWIIKSNLIRYLIFNVQILNIKEKIIRKFNILKNKDYYISNMVFSTNKERVADSKNAINIFFNKINILNIKKKNFFFIIDGRFYGEKNIENSFFYIMREYFLKECKMKGFNCIDMKKHFDVHYEMNQQKFSLEKDGHWNKIAHELVGKKLSETFKKINIK